MCSLSIAQKISIGHVIGRLPVSVHWRVTIWNKQTKLTIFGRFLFSLIITRAIILKQLFVSGSVNIGEYSTRLIFTNIYNQVSRFRPQPRIPTWSTENWHIAGYLFLCFSRMCSYTGKQRCGMNSKFVLGTFKAADCGTAAMRFCCDGEYCNGKPDSVFLHHSVI